MISDRLAEMLGIGAHGQRLPRAGEALPGRDTPMRIGGRHHVHGHPIVGAIGEGAFAHMRQAYFGMGCFWGAERAFWTLPGVFATAVGYAGGSTPHPTYREVCSGLTGHAEVVRVIFAPAQVTFAELLRLFWERHDPTQGMRQGNDSGTQYRSLLGCDDANDYAIALASRDAYQARLHAAGKGAITTEILHPVPSFYYAEDEHQQYLAKNPGGYCGLAGTGVSCPLPG